VASISVSLRAFAHTHNERDDEYHEKDEEPDLRNFGSTRSDTGEPKYRSNDCNHKEYRCVIIKMSPATPGLSWTNWLSSDIFIDVRRRADKTVGYAAIASHPAITHGFVRSHTVSFRRC
jgi:hypothetical protein